MKLISLFDGIGGFPLAWCNVTGQAPADLHYQSSEIEPWPMAVVRQRFPNVEELGDVNSIRHTADNESAKLEQSETGRSVSSAGSRASADDHIITFGSPCQDLSIAGRGAGLTAERSGLFHAAMRLVRDVQPRFFIWENVVGALSTNKGEDFAKVLQSTADLGYDAVWTVLDAQWCGVPQRRRRIFFLGVRDGVPAGADIFSFGRRAARICRDEIQLITDSRHRNYPAGREAREAAAETIEPGTADRILRRLTPVECLRLQGFPDQWFEGVPGYSNAKAYRAIGNSVAIPCVEWIFQQVLEFDKTQD